MYFVRFYRGYNGPSDHDYAEIGQAPTLEKAAALRFVCGDLVVDHHNRPVKDDSWLWDWEREKPDCYASRAIRRWAS